MVKLSNYLRALAELLDAPSKPKPLYELQKAQDATAKYGSMYESAYAEIQKLKAELERRPTVERLLQVRQEGEGLRAAEVTGLKRGRESSLHQPHPARRDIRAGSRHRVDPSSSGPLVENAQLKRLGPAR